MLHPEAHELRDVLMGLRFKGGDQVVEIEAAAAAGVQHVTKRGVKHLRPVAILKAIEEKKILGTQGSRVFLLPARLWLRRNGTQQAADGFRARFGTTDGLAAAGGGESRQGGERRILLEKPRIPAVTKPACGQRGRGGSDFWSATGKIDHDRVAGDHLRGNLF